MRVFGFVKVRNEIIREGNLYRLLAQLELLCDGGVICDDASTDGTLRHLIGWTAGRPWHSAGRPWRFYNVTPEEHARDGFLKEMHVKQAMLDELHDAVKLGLVEQPDWLFWLDGDELLSDADALAFRGWLEREGDKADAWAFHYTQCWRGMNWARVDDGFDLGWFWKLWRYTPDLEFELSNELHSYQFPKNYLMPILRAVTHHGGSFGRAQRAPFEIIHLGNVGKNLVWKAIQYRNSGRLADASMKRHLYFTSAAEYRAVTIDSAACADLPLIAETDPRKVRTAMVYTEHEKKVIEQMGDMRGRAGLVLVTIPTFNRGDRLERTVRSVLDQTYGNWALVVLDDGSTDDTKQVMRKLQDLDPRIFYCRYETNRGGVEMNEIGCALACEFAETWVRLGSDDYFKPHKLELDVRALREFPDAVACYGPYRDLHGGRERDLRGLPHDATGALHRHAFTASWANIAVRTSALKQVHARHGDFVASEIRNMEDYLLNVRLSYFGEFIWRGRLKNGKFIAGQIVGDTEAVQLLIGGPPEQVLEHDAIWSVASDGASQNYAICAADTTKTERHLNGPQKQFTPVPRPASRVVVLDYPKGK